MFLDLAPKLKSRFTRVLTPTVAEKANADTYPLRENSAPTTRLQADEHSGESLRSWASGHSLFSFDERISKWIASG